MPWLELLPMDQRIQLVTEYQSGLFTMTELAEQYGISRKTGYKWLDRYAGAGVAGWAVADGVRAIAAATTSDMPKIERVT